MALLLCSFPLVLRIPVPRIWLNWDDVIELVGYGKTLLGQFTARVTRKVPGATPAVVFED
jgi:hypothetical protein